MTMRPAMRFFSRPLLKRWIAFNFVGCLGIGIQLGMLAALHGGLGLHYLAATALAVEAAVLHNFVWHERWTWADRTRRNPRESLIRLVRFNLTNGAISIGSNLFLMNLFVAGIGLPYLPANLLSIVLCSLANFLAGDRYVFRNARETDGRKCALARSPGALTFQDGDSITISLRSDRLEGENQMNDPSSQVTRLDVGYGYGRVLEMPFAAAVSHTREALKTEGFGVLCEIDIKEKLKEKLGVDFTNYVILGACNPPLAYQALQQEINLGLLLPCNVVVYEKGGQSVVAAIDAARMLSIVQNPALAAQAQTVNSKLRRVIDSL